MSIFDRLQGLDKSVMPSAKQALPGRHEKMPLPDKHYVLGTPLAPPFPAPMQVLTVGMGCFWGAEKLFWQQPGVYSTAVGYAAGLTPNPSYEEVCSGMTGHNEVVQVVYDPNQTQLEALLKVFWEGHNPTQGMRQGNDRGTQYRSGIYLPAGENLSLAHHSAKQYQQLMSEAGLGEITTEILVQPTFYYAEDYHQQYLAKNPSGYCGLVPIEHSGQPRYPLSD